jgi:sulfate adenylyltransferase
MEGIRLLSADTRLNPPYGGVLVNLMAEADRAHELKTMARDLPSIALTTRELCDLEMLASGAFSPLTGFLGKADYQSVCENRRLADGRLWPLPVMLGAPPALAERLSALSSPKVVLRDIEGALMAILTVSECWEPDRQREAECLAGTTQPTHPEVVQLRRDGVYLAGQLEVLALPVHYDFSGLRRTPEQLRESLGYRATGRLMAYQPRGLLHRTHVELTRRLGQMNDASVLILGAVGRVYPDDAGYHARVRAWRAALDYYPNGNARLNLAELSVRRAGVRAVLLSAIVARNFGASHFVVEHDYDECGDAATGDPLYGQYTTQEALIAHERELGIETVMMRDLIYEEDRPEQVLVGRASSRHIAGGRETGDEARARQLVRWFSYPSVLQEWQKPFRGRPPQGFTVFFTGLSGAGKSTIAQILAAKLLEIGDRHVTLLDGDAVRKQLSSELGFSRAHRDLNVCRLGFVAGLITQYRGIAICAPIAPYAATRAQVRAMVEPHGGFIEVYVATPLSVCEARDRKGLYARARAGVIPEFTGVSDPYEAPENPEVRIDTGKLTAVQAAEAVLVYLAGRGLLTEREVRPAMAARAAVMRRDTASDAGASSWGWPAARQPSAGSERPTGAAAGRDTGKEIS